MTVRPAVVVLAIAALAACDGGRNEQPATRTPPPRAIAPGDTIELDRWNLDEVVVRLEEAGLAVRRTEEPVAHPSLRQSGTRLRVSQSELHLFIYPDAPARQSDGASLPGETIPPDTVGAPAGRVIVTNNLIAIYYPRTELQFERVSNVLLARYVEDR